MQFHLNGYKPGDPSLADVDARHKATDSPTTLPSKVDVLIVGCGPAGLTLAAQLAAFPSIKTCIVEQKSGPLMVGQADGIACRTMEMFNAFGFVDRVLKEAYWVNETTFWKPDESDSSKIVRQDRIQDTEDGLSEFPHVILNQARVHDMYLDTMLCSSTRLAPHYSRQLIELEINHDALGNSAKHPVTAKFSRVDSEHAGEVENIQAKYVVGCDGARSTVRKSLGLELFGDSANKAWGVMDVLAVTDFPDIRLKSAIHSANEGSLLIIPREGGYMVRLYIELEKLHQEERVAAKNIQIDHLINAAQRIFRPYALEVKDVVWWSVYEIGQRLCDSFDDVPIEEANQRFPHVFIAGDACHTHSPKAGQGMNVSMRDSFNLGWKLASVLQEKCAPTLLHTYSAERQRVAKDLIDFDRELALMFSTRPDSSKPSSQKKADTTEFQRYFQKHAQYMAGTSIQYLPSMLTATSEYQDLAAGFRIGQRFHSAPVIRLADAKPTQLGHAVKADGRWRLFVFGNKSATSSPSTAVVDLCEFLAQSKTSPVVRYTQSTEDIDSTLDIRAIFQQSHRELSINDMPQLLRPLKGQFGLCDYEKVFCADVKHEDIYDLRSIDRENGCCIIVRPDQHISHVLPLDAHTELCAFFDAFMLDKN